VLEQANAILLAALILQGRAQQPRPQRHPHDRQVTRDGVGERQATPVREELFLQCGIDEGEGDRLQIPSHGKRLQHALLSRPALGQMVESLRRERVALGNLVVSDDARHLFDQIRFDRNVEPVRRGCDLPAFRIRGHRHLQGL